MKTLQHEPKVARERLGYFKIIDRSILLGYIFLASSSFIFALSEFLGLKSEDEFALFIIHFSFAIVFTIVLIVHKSYGIIRSWKKEHIGKTVILLTLFLISAYALNRELPIFNDSTTWLCGYLVLTSLVLLSFQYYHALPSWLNTIQFFLLGSALLFYTYLSIYVAEYYVFGFIGLILVGIGGHIFVPITLLIAAVALARHYAKRVQYFGLAAGAVLTLLYSVAFVTEWNNRTERINTVVRELVMYPERELPIWVRLGEVIPNDWITERMLKTDFVYATRSNSRGWFSLPQGMSWEEEKKHDPFVVLSTLNDRISLTDEEKIMILRSISDSRHRSNERLWSGANLTTSNIVTDIDLYPDLRIAYTEKYLDIRNNSNINRWRNTEEAIYTFQLPEGSVVTSLSLWINGKEEKAILTSKGKATEAYKTIVGVEARDPSVVHWQEGNTVSVRIFPCTPDAERKVKIGFTSPLRDVNGKIQYRNITFQGPSPEDAKETVRVRMMGGETLELNGFERDKNGDYINVQDYDPDFKIDFNSVPLRSDNIFNFNGDSYSIKPFVPEMENIKFSEIFLDVNNSWTKNEMAIFRQMIREGKTISVYMNDEFVKLTPENSTVLDALQKHNYSLFPIHKLKTKEDALLVTKGTAVSPYLIDLKETAFAGAMKKYFVREKNVYVFNLGNETSNYVRSLRELRALKFASGSEEDLVHVLETGTFPVAKESENEVVLHESHLKIVKAKTPENAVKSNAPDHLARLFAYNNIMRKAGKFYFAKDDPANLVAEASMAYVVSPVSSLIVLETEEDYERFDITDNDNSLKNASKQSSGAVPEPHEWALIVLFVLLAGIYLKFKL